MPSENLLKPQLGLVWGDALAFAATGEMHEELALLCRGIPQTTPDTIAWNANLVGQRGQLHATTRKRIVENGLAVGIKFTVNSASRTGQIHF
jgi:hypothetical protein